MIVINTFLMYNDSVSHPEFPQPSTPPLDELRPRDEVFDNIMDSFSVLYRRTKVALELAKAVYHPGVYIDDNVVTPVRQQFINNEPPMTVDGAADQLYERFERTNQIAKDIYRPIRYNNIGDNQPLTPPINLENYRLSKNSE